MTGSLQVEKSAQSYIKMIKDNKMPSPKNQELLNGICKGLVVSQSKSLLEFVDILIEKFMYPRSHSKYLMHLLTDKECAIIDDEANEEEYEKFETFDLGHPRLLELILIRQKVFQLKFTGNEGWKRTEYIPKLLRKVEQVYVLLVHLLQVLSDHIEVPAHSKFYRDFITESISDFQSAFESFKSLDYIFLSLIRNAEKSGESDDSLFHVNDALLLDIKQFTNDNLAWYESLMTESIALKEYLLVKNRIFQKENENQPLEEGIAPYALEIIFDIKFEKFLENRKARLNISNRRIF